MSSTPFESNWRTSWELALNGQECSSSPWVCIEHFSPDDYVFVNQGKKIVIKKNAVPTIFNVYLEVEETGDDECMEAYENMEIVPLSGAAMNGDDGSSSIKSKSDDMESLRLENATLNRKIEQMKSKFDSDKLIWVARNQVTREVKHRQAIQINSLKKELAECKKELERLTEMTNGNICIPANKVDIFFIKKKVFSVFMRRLI